MRLWLKAVLPALFLLCASGIAQAADWIIVQVTGQAWVVAPDGTAQRPMAGQVLPEGWTLGIGPDARALVVRGADSMTVSPNTVITITQRGAETEIIQQEGEVAYEVEHRAARNFSVETALLAAAVKGTAFTVTVDDAGAEVDVERGSVEVLSLASGESALLFAGQQGAVAADDRSLVVTGGSSASPVVQTGPRMPHVPETVMPPVVEDRVGVTPAVVPVVEDDDHDTHGHGGDGHGHDDDDDHGHGGGHGDDDNGHGDDHGGGGHDDDSGHGGSGHDDDDSGHGGDDGHGGSGSDGHSDDD